MRLVDVPRAVRARLVVVESEARARTRPSSALDEAEVRGGVERGVPAEDEERVDRPAFMSETRAVESELVDGLGLDGIRKEDGRAEVREGVVEEMRERVDLGRGVLAGTTRPRPACAFRSAAHEAMTTGNAASASSPATAAKRAAAAAGRFGGDSVIR